MNELVYKEFAKLTSPYIADINDHCSEHLQKDRALIPLIASITQGIDVKIPDQVEKALSNGIKPETILEMVYQLVPVVGILKVEQALKPIQTTFAQHKFSLPAVRIYSDENFGAKIQKQLYGIEIKNLLKDLPDSAAGFIPQALTEHFFNDYYKRQTLNIRDRERYELLALITLNVDFQIKAHAHGSLKAGNTESELVWSTVQLLPYIGFPFVINSVQIIHQAAMQIAKEK